MRPRANDHNRARYQWRFGRIPETIRRGSKDLPNPFKKVAIFVVHGIGEQQDTDTAVALRRGVEDSLGLVELQKWDVNQKDAWILPPPYLYDGHWAHYHDLEAFEDDLESDLDVLTTRQRQFFKNAWRDRSLGWFRSLRWLVAQGLKLVRWCSPLKKPFYLLLTLLVSVVMFAAGVWPRSRKFLVDYVNDARLYLEPKGDFEHEMVQLIDRRVGRLFLKTIGLNWEFEELTNYRSLVANGQPHHFDQVVWLAHSLGTIISFNVIGDILTKCIERRKQFAQGRKDIDHCSTEPGNCPSEVLRIENSLRRFVTIGSPIDKVCFLYKTRSNDTGGNSVLRSWPNEYLPGNALDLLKTSTTTSQSDTSWWVNVFYGSDPISGPLDSVEKFLGVSKGQTLITNISPFGLRVPLHSHVAYWRDKGFVTKLLELTYPGYTKLVKCSFFRPISWKDEDAVTGGPDKEAANHYFVRSWPTWIHGWLSGFGLFWITLIGATAVIALVIHWEKVWPWIKGVILQ